VAKKIFTTGGLTDAQIKRIYALAEKMNAGISLYGNTPAPDRSSFTWLVQGGVVSVWKVMKHLKTLR
jgi:hypothetical protein